MNTEINDPWESVTEGDFIKFDKELNNNLINITFIDNNPSIVNSPFKKDDVAFEFQVIEIEEPGRIKTFSITSYRLMRKLKELRPLQNNSFAIRRIGEGMKTDYEIVKISKQDTLK